MNAIKLSANVGQKAYKKWLAGWKNGHGHDGQATLEAAWKNAVCDGKPVGCSWTAYGYLMAREQMRGRRLYVLETAE